ncbi:hypothetical protein CDAR_301251 [Caerostris darwini]|uniref:Uncharacterized protein n=1 Tax=Caerostris darwini TaxID=1538125 RepID=A0AAV4W323_9ARAC|nr:hypothetical protein CDAR_301251 [Caerostris darwini]
MKCIVTPGKFQLLITCNSKCHGATLITTTWKLSPSLVEKSRLSETISPHGHFRPPRLTTLTDDFISIKILVDIINLKARLATSWLQPPANRDNPDLAIPYDQAFQSTKPQTFSLCSQINIAPLAIYFTMAELENKVQQYHLQLPSEQPETPASQKATPPPPQKQHKHKLNGNKRLHDADGFRAPPKHLTWKTSTVPTTRSQPSPPSDSKIPCTNFSNNLDMAERNFFRTVASQIKNPSILCKTQSGLDIQQQSFKAR